MADGQEGRGGWSWYTGAAGWYYRTVQEELLGLSLREGLLTIRPNLAGELEGVSGNLATAQSGVGDHHGTGSVARRFAG